MKKTMSTILILVLVLSSTIPIHADNVTIDSIKLELKTESIENLINDFISLQYIGNSPIKRYELGLLILEEIKNRGNGDSDYIKFADKIYEYATTYKSSFDMALGEELSNYLLDKTLKNSYFSKFNEYKIKYSTEQTEIEYNDPSISNDKPDSIIENKPKPSTPEVDTGNSSSEFPEGAIYSTIDYVHKDGKHLKVIKYFNDKNVLISTKTVPTPSDELFMCPHNYVSDNSQNQDNSNNNEIDYPNNNVPTPNVDFENINNSILYDDNGKLLAEKVKDGYKINIYKFYISQNKSSDSPTYDDIGLITNVDTIQYEQLKKVFRNLSVKEKGYFVEESNRFVAIIGNNTYSFKLNEKITADELRKLFYNTEFEIILKISETRLYTSDTDYTVLSKNNDFEPFKSVNCEFTINDFENKAIVVDNTILFPLKTIARELNLKIKQTDSEITLFGNNQIFTYKINEPTITIDGKGFQLSENTLIMANGEVYGVFNPEILKLNYDATIEKINNGLLVNFKLK